MYKEGKSGNPNGRPKGAKNKIGGDLREMISEFLKDQFPVIVEDFKKLKPREKAKIYGDLLQYGLPRLQSISMETQLENLTDEQLTELMERLIKVANDK